MHFRKISIFVGFLLILQACQPKPVVQKNDLISKNWPHSLPDSLWISQNLVERMENLKSYYHDALRKLAEGDTIGAQIYFEQAFNQLAELSDEDRNTLSYWTELDSMLQQLDSTYQRVYLGVGESRN